jgi:hypothetical protein
MNCPLAALAGRDAHRVRVSTTRLSPIVLIRSKWVEGYNAGFSWYIEFLLDFA